MHADPNAPWSPLSVSEVAERFAAVDVDWWVAGGVAIDLFLGYQARQHADLDLEMRREDREALFDVFEGWELFVVSASTLIPWRRGEYLDAQVFGVWGRASEDQRWGVEVLLADGDASTWKFRRDNTIQLPRGELTMEGPGGVRYCTPEVQLLYKAKRHRPKDDADMVRCLNRMTEEQLLWLIAAIERSEPGHPWLDLIARWCADRELDD